MKKIILFFALLFTLPASAQYYWSPITTTDIFHFQHDGDNIISTSFFVRSYTNTLVDTTFTFNTIGCDSCITFPAGPSSCATCYGTIRLPQAITGYTLTKDLNGRCTFAGTTTQVLESQAQVGATWIFDITTNVTAQLVAATSGTVLGQPDSLKITLLSSGDSLVWSKFHGLVLWPDGAGSYYRLVGIEGQNLGIHVPRMKDYFDFQVGDMFEYSAEDFITFNEYDFSTHKITITSRQQIADTLLYNYTGALSVSGNDPNAPPWAMAYAYHQSTSGTLVYVDSTRHLGNAFNHQMLSNNATMYVLDHTGVYPGAYRPDSLWYEAHLFVDTLQIQGIRFGGHNPVDQYSTYPFYGALGSLPVWGHGDTTELRSVNYSTSNNTSLFYTGCELKVGLGQTRAQAGSMGFPDGFLYSVELTAYRKGNDTVGVFTPDDVLLSAATTNALPEHMRILPNPAQTECKVVFSSPANAQIRIYTLMGELIYQDQQITNTFQIPVEQWANGCYVIDVQCGQQHLREKMIVQH